MLTLHRAALVLPDPADPTAPSVADGAVLVHGELIAALGPYAELAAAHPRARLRDWGDGLLTPGLRNPYGHWLLEYAYHPDPREEIGDAPVPGGLVGPVGSGEPVRPVDEARCGASARRGLQRMLGFGVTAVAGPFERAAVRTAVARSGLTALPGPAGLPGAEGPLDPLAVLPLAAAVHGRLAVGGRADFAVFGSAGAARPRDRADAAGAGAGSGAGAGAVSGVESGAGRRPVGCLATVLAGRLVYRRR
ncbi:imidazolonepropionase-like domain-containing protein [Kitasatospora sp. NPDC091207]|uniref:amidohydrolase family protein n=1 Tax=Kitasatospora sp. NPDC091207 TaxID=3364083 RepID=UPI003825AFA0